MKKLLNLFYGSKYGIIYISGIICLLLNPIPSTAVLLILKKCKVRIIGAPGVGFLMFAILLIAAGMRIV